MYNLTSTILTLPKIIGCEDFPKSDHGKLLVEDIERFINEQYRVNGKYVLDAFNMAATHQLFMDGKRVDPSTFGRFLSRAIVGKVLTAYKEYLSTNRAQAKPYNPNQLPEHQTKKLTPEEAHDLILKWCREDGELPTIAPYLTAYRYLRERNLVKEAGNETVDTRRTLLLGKSIKVEVSAKRIEAEKWYLMNMIR